MRRWESVCDKVDLSLPPLYKNGGKEEGKGKVEEIKKEGKESVLYLQVCIGETQDTPSSFATNVSRVLFLPSLTLVLFPLLFDQSKSGPQLPPYLQFLLFSARSQDKTESIIIVRGKSLRF